MAASAEVPADAPAGQAADEHSFSVGCYNVLCPTYAIKWNEREGKDAAGESNWDLRWPVMQGIISRACWDVLCLQEVEHDLVPAIVGAIAAGGYEAHYFKHEKRPPDGVLIAFRKAAFTELAVRPGAFGGAAFGCVDLMHSASGRQVRVVNSHCRGGNADQLAALAAFADEASTVDVTVVVGDFNEDFTTKPAEVTAPAEEAAPAAAEAAGAAASAQPSCRCPFPAGASGSYSTLLRASEPELPQLSRPPHKQAQDQSSGKGKVDWIWVRGRAGSGGCPVELFRDEASRRAILESHRPCEATGQWPSDHGTEALSVRLRRSSAHDVQ